MSQGLAGLRGVEDNVGRRLAEVREALAKSNAAVRELPALEERLAAMRKATPYRSEDLKALETSLEEARSGRALRASLRIEEAQWMREAEIVRLALVENGIRRVTLPALENVSVAAPCDASWAHMKGDTDVRFCSSCQKNVYNLSMMSREEAEAVLRAGSGKDLCVRLFRRPDGTVLTDDCPVGLRRMRFWRRTKSVAAGGLIALALGLTYAKFVGPVVRMTPTGGATSRLEPG
jgi:hypothetical protein